MATTPKQPSTPTEEESYGEMPEVLKKGLASLPAEVDRSKDTLEETKKEIKYDE